MDKIRESWKAIVAFLIPIAWTTAIQINDAFSEWATEQGVWSGIILAAFTSLGVWLKANQPAPTV